MSKKPKGFKAFDKLMRKLVKVPPKPKPKRKSKLLKKR
jgi:hypothetical protein